MALNHGWSGARLAGAIAGVLVIAALAAAPVAAKGAKPTAKSATKAAAAATQAAPAVVMGIYRDGTLLVEAGEPPVPLENVAEGDDVELVLATEGTTSFRAAEAHISYDAAGLDYLNWQLSKALEGALSMAPDQKPDRNEVVFRLAMTQTVHPQPGRLFEIGRFTLHVRDLTHRTVGVSYMEILDDSLASTTRGELPVKKTPKASVRPPIEKRDLGDGVWWSVAGPNPFSHHVSLVFSTPDTLYVTINVTDTAGKLIRPIVSDKYKGRFTTNWNGTNFSGEKVKPGEYLFTIEAGDKRDSQPVQLASPDDMPKKK
jgi:hypothetical protein